MMANRKGRSRKKKKSPIDWIDIISQILIGLFTGIILMIIEKLWR